MSVFADSDRVMEGLSWTLQQRVLPHLPEGNARFSARAAIEMTIHLLHRRHAPVRLPDREHAMSMAAEISRLTRYPVDANSTHDLVALLHQDSRFYRDDDAAYRALLAANAAAPEDVFEAPSDAVLGGILRRWTGDDRVEARLAGRAVGGYSKQTLFFDQLRDGEVIRQLVMRRDLPMADADRTSVAAEYPVLKAVHAAGLPVAEPLFLETDRTVLGTPFLVSQRMPGRLYGDSLRLHETPDFDPAEALGTLLAQLHAIDFTRIDLPGFDDGRTGVADQEARIDQWIGIYSQSIDIPAAAMEVGLAWLRANAHLVVDARSLVHGDVGYHNILFNHGKVSALVDWELTHVGHPAEDVAYVLSFIEQPEALLRYYFRAGGPPLSEGALAYYRVFGNLRNAIYGAVAMRQFNEGATRDIGVLPIVLSSYSQYVVALDAMLSELIDRHGFRWRMRGEGP